MPEQSIFGSIIHMQASVTYPTGIILTSFPDDNDPFDIPEVQVGDTAMGANGDMASWSTANPIEITFSVMANSIDHQTLNKLYEANRPQKGKLAVQDIITVTRTEPNGRVTNFSGGKIVSGTPMSSFSAAGRVKNPTYTIRFSLAAPATAGIVSPI